MSEPFVSVVTPVYSDEPYLEECIKSVISQSHQDFEYIICNNHSTDRSGEIAADYAVDGFTHPRRQSARVFTAGKELQLRPRQIDDRAKYCKMLLSDDWMYPQCLQQMLEVAVANPRIVLVSAYRLIGSRPDCFGVPVGRSTFRRQGSLPLAAVRHRLSFRKPVNCNVRSRGRPKARPCVLSRRIDSSWT